MSALKPVADYRLVREHPFPVLFLAVSGSHMFGFESADSDYDLRGMHAAPTRDVLSLPTLDRVRQTVELAEPAAPGSEELVTHEIAKFLSLTIKNGGNFLEQILSPHVVVTSPEHDRLRAIAPRILSKRHVEHYLGFGDSQVKLMRRRPDKETKIFLYIFRVLMSGIVAARERLVIAHLPTLLPYFDEREAPFPAIATEARRLIAWKRASAEESVLEATFSAEVLWGMVETLRSDLEASLARTTLPDVTPPDVIVDVNDLLLDVRAAN